MVVGPKKQPTDVLLGCVNYELPCPFSFKQSRDGLPVLFVDEQILPTGVPRLERLRELVAD